MFSIKKIKLYIRYDTTALIRLSDDNTNPLIVGAWPRTERTILTRWSDICSAPNRALREQAENRYEIFYKTALRQTSNVSAKIATSDPMRSGSVDEKGEDEEDAEDDDKENMYEEAFAKMKRAAGVSEIEEVVHR